MFDMGQPVSWQVIVGTIAAIFAVTGIGIYFVKRCVKQTGTKVRK
ncbi:hypothetical protein [Hydrogenimonas sp.]|nr:hypothetical protein [Hydrogenimonas sp.]